ncbi:MAG: tetratricopeptide repeat protein [Hydrococcus sp. SU_1_0]|nr:tetratricopeptide repeat protein [Hydrococcus sp. SU_1_0]
MKLVQSHPHSTTAHSSQEWLTTEAVAKHKAGDLVAAIDYYLQVIAIAQRGGRSIANQAPDWIYGNAITLLAKVDRFDEGIELGQQALAEYPTSDEIYRAIGIAAGKKQDDEQSINCFSQAIKLNPEQPVWVYYHLIELLTKKRALDQAIAIGNQGLQFNPDSHWLHYYLGSKPWLLRKNGNRRSLLIFVLWS